jgi:hypothetical protein
LKSRNKIKKYGNKYAGHFPKMKDGPESGFLTEWGHPQSTHEMLVQWTSEILKGQEEWQAAMEELRKKESLHKKRLKKIESYRNRLLSMTDEI